MAGQAGGPAGVGKIEHERVVAEQGETVSGQRSSQCRFAARWRRGKSENSLVGSDGGRVDRQQTVDACNRGVNAAVQPQRFFTGVGVRAALNRDSVAPAVMKIMMPFAAEQELVSAHLPAHFGNGFTQQSLGSKAEGDLSL